MTQSIAIILPAYNEELTIVDTMKDFHQACPEAAIYVVDNASTDQTQKLASAAYKELGCRGEILFEATKGKAAAVRKAFLEIDADIYVMVDADMTYPASDLPSLLEPVLDGRADMVCGDRLSAGLYQEQNKRPLHNFGNQLVRRLINWLFRGSLRDILTGYRVMNRRFVKNYPILARGFGLETEMSIHALDKGYTTIEVPTEYKDRPEGSHSKLNTLGDGVLILRSILVIFIRYRPLIFFSVCAFLFACFALAAGSIPVIEYFETGKISRFPLAILATGLAILAMLSFAIAVILDSVSSAQRFSHGLKQLHWEAYRRADVLKAETPRRLGD